MCRRRDRQSFRGGCRLSSEANLTSADYTTSTCIVLRIGCLDRAVSAATGGGGSQKPGRRLPQLRLPHGRFRGHQAILETCFLLPVRKTSR